LARILIADGNEIIRKLLKALIEGHEGWSVCGEALDGHGAVANTAELKPDLVILDLAMSGLNGLQAARQISKTFPTLPILLHTLHNFPEMVEEAKKFGIRQVVGKNESGDRLLSAIEANLGEKPQRLAGRRTEFMLTPTEADSPTSTQHADSSGITADADTGPPESN
jgi:DNA-binding NarL/FixJ family response regulator